MPELPEVETIRHDLEDSLLNKEIVSVEIRKTKMVRGIDQDFIRSLTGQSFTGIARRGKLLIFVLSTPDEYMLLHLKMTGQLLYKTKHSVIAGGHSQNSSDELDTLPNKYSHIIITFSDDSVLYFNDLRQFGYVELVQGTERTRVEEAFGIEPLTPAFTRTAFDQLIKRHARSTIKGLLLNQKAIAGIGNIYADEICFRALVRPDRLVNSLSKTESDLVFTVIEPLLKEAISKRGTTFNTYRDTKGNKGSFVDSLQVYRRTGQPCLRCRKENITRIKLQGRGTHFCPHCQRAA